MSSLVSHAANSLIGADMLDRSALIIMARTCTHCKRSPDYSFDLSPLNIAHIDCANYCMADAGVEPLPDTTMRTFVVEMEQLHVRVKCYLCEDSMEGRTGVCQMCIEQHAASECPLCTTRTPSPSPRND